MPGEEGQARRDSVIDHRAAAARLLDCHPQGSVSVKPLSFTGCVQVLLANTLMTSAWGKD